MALDSVKKDCERGSVLVLSSFLLLIIYVVGVGFTSIFAKIFAKNFINMKISKIRKTYWSDLNLKKKPIKTYYRQFYD